VDQVVAEGLVDQVVADDREFTELSGGINLLSSWMFCGKHEYSSSANICTVPLYSRDTRGISCDSHMTTLTYVSALRSLPSIRLAANVGL
jgi:hypothetical protein